MKKRFLLVVVGLIVICFVIYDRRDYAFKTDYYEAVNEEILSVNHLKEEEYTWSRFIEAQEKSDEDVEKIVSDVVSGNVLELDEQSSSNIRNTYQKAIDMQARDEEGMRELIPVIEKVFNSQSILELMDAIMVVEDEFGVDVLTNIVVEADYMNHDTNIIYFYPVTFAFGASSDYIVNPDYMTYKAYLKRACVQLWKVYGYDAKEAKDVVNRVFSFYEEVGKHSKLASDLENVSNYYQMYSRDDFLSIYGNIRGEEYLRRKGILDIENYSIVDLGQYQYLNDSLTEDNLELWKDVIVMKLLSSYAFCGSSDYVKVVTELNQSLLGIKKEKTIEEQALDIVKDLYSEDIDRIYEKRVLDRDQEELLKDVFEEIKGYYGKMLRNNDWLESQTIEKALRKLENMRVIIGFDEEDGGFIEKGEVEIFQEGSLLKDVIELGKMKRNEELVRLKNGKRDMAITQSVVNAYYQPIDNSIVIPAAFVYLLNPDADYYERLGSIGMILAHEVTHGFDGNGSQFDEEGNMKSWWTEEDYKEFEKLKKEVSAYYSKYEVFAGKYINGERTVNENIADLGALSCIVGIAHEKEASDNEMREIFSSFASIWASQESDAYMNLLLLQDVHAPNKYRVNAVLSSIDDYYRVYGVHSWNDMNIVKEDRVHIW